MRWFFVCAHEIRLIKDEGEEKEERKRYWKQERKMLQSACGVWFLIKREKKGAEWKLREKSFA